MTKDEIQCIQELQEMVTAAMKAEELIIKKSSDLRIVLFNLQIEGARIEEANGIEPIAEKLESTIESIHSIAQTILSTNIERMNEIFKQLDAI